MRLPKCCSCDRVLASEAYQIRHVKKKLSGNAKRKQYYWKVVGKTYACPNCIEKLTATAGAHSA